MDIEVNKYDIEDGQTVVINVPVPAGLGMLEVQGHLRTVAESFNTEFERTGTKVNTFIFPVSEGGIRPYLEVFEKPEPGSTVILHIPVGGIKSGDIPRYLKTVRDGFADKWDEKFPGAHLMVCGIREDGSKIEIKTKK